MRSTISNRRVVAILLLAVVALTAFPKQVYAVDSTFWNRFDEFFDREEYADAWNLLSTVDKDDKDGSINVSRGIMLLTGLGVDQDTCKAVDEFEIARTKKAILATGYLNFVYNGAYKQIAAEEGERSSLLEIGENTLNIYRSGSSISPKSDQYLLAKAYSYFYRAMEQKNIEAILRLSEVEVEMRSLKIEIPSKVESKFVEVICPVRGYQ